jgi:anaerobic selenocysteine-containing dehydrogenase
MIVLWGSNIASQPNTARHIISARRRGAKVVTIDVRRTEVAAQSDEVLLIRPGSDAALALAVMHVIITGRLYDPAFVEAHTIGLRNCRRTSCPSLPHGEQKKQILKQPRSSRSPGHTPPRDRP